MDCVYHLSVNKAVVLRRWRLLVLERQCNSSKWTKEPIGLHHQAALALAKVLAFSLCRMGIVGALAFVRPLVNTENSLNFVGTWKHADVNSPLHIWKHLDQRHENYWGQFSYISDVGVAQFLIWAQTFLFVTVDYYLLQQPRDWCHRGW